MVPSTKVCPSSLYRPSRGRGTILLLLPLLLFLSLVASLTPASFFYTVRAKVASVKRKIEDVEADINAVQLNICIDICFNPFNLSLYRGNLGLKASSSSSFPHQCHHLFLFFFFSLISSSLLIILIPSKLCFIVFRG